MEKKILILGVGNILLRDEGIGVRAVEYLQDQYIWPEHVRLLEGGTQGMMLMGAMQDCDLLLVLDAVLGDGPAGSLYRLKGDDLRQSLGFKDSMHQTDLVDTLICCQLNGHSPESVVLGMQPEDWHSLEVGLSPNIAARIPDLCRMALEELQKHHIQPIAKD